MEEQIDQVKERKKKEFHAEIQEEEDAAKAEEAEYNRGEAENKVPERIAQYLRADEGVEQELINMAKFEFEQNFSNSGWPRKQEFEEAVTTKTRNDWHQAISRAESGLLERIRNNLIIIAMQKIVEKTKNDGFVYPDLKPVKGQEEGGILLQENFAKIAKFLFVDLGISESKQLPSLSFSIERVHSFYQMVELEKDRQAQEGEVQSPMSHQWLTNMRRH